MVTRLLLLYHQLNTDDRLFDIKRCAMEDNFLEAAILNWDDIEPNPAPALNEAELRPSTQLRGFNPSAVLLALYVLAILVLMYRWYVMRAYQR